MTMREIMEVADNPEGVRVKLTAGTASRAPGAFDRDCAGLGAFVLVVFAVTIVRLGSGALTGPDYMRPVETTR